MSCNVDIFGVRYDSDAKSTRKPRGYELNRERLPSFLIAFMFLPRPSALRAHIRFASNLNRPSPPPLPREQQREFENLIRRAQTPNSSDSALNRHPDAPEPLLTEFDGDINPSTGEKGGPKREPVHQWVEGDWSFKGRVSDF